MAISSKKKPRKDSPEKQHARFVEAAYKVEADQATDAMDRAFKKVDPRKLVHKKTTSNTS